MVLVVKEKVSMLVTSGRVIYMRHGPPPPIVAILIGPIEVAGPQYVNGSQ